MEFALNSMAVASGGALGALGRYWVALALNPLWTQGPSIGWPWHTLLVNVSGSLLMGVGMSYVFASGLTHPSWLKTFLFAGFLGGFTTYSSFAFESLSLFQVGRFGAAIGYLLATLFLCLVFVALGWRLGVSFKSI